MQHASHYGNRYPQEASNSQNWMSTTVRDGPLASAVWCSPRRTPIGLRGGGGSEDEGVEEVLEKEDQSEREVEWAAEMDIDVQGTNLEDHDREKEDDHEEDMLWDVQCCQGTCSQEGGWSSVAISGNLSSLMVVSLKSCSELRMRLRLMAIDL